VYTEKLTKLIEAKVAGEEIAAPPSQEPAQIINLMDALRASVARAEQQDTDEEKPPKRMASSKGKERRTRGATENREKRGENAAVSEQFRISPWCKLPCWVSVMENQLPEWNSNWRQWG
jgi:hypothetical protein